jgi:hypothetical protein
MSQLFSAAKRSTHWKELRIYYFHNCVYGAVYPTEQFRDPVKITDLVADCGPHYKLVLVGDALMAPWELLGAPSYGESEKGAAGVAWLLYLREHFERSVWLNPEPPSVWAGSTIETIGSIFPMFEAHPDGLSEAIAELMRGSLRRRRNTVAPRLEGHRSTWVVAPASVPVCQRDSPPLKTTRIFVESTLVRGLLCHLRMDTTSNLCRPTRRARRFDWLPVRHVALGIAAFLAGCGGPADPTPGPTEDPPSGDVLLLPPATPARGWQLGTPKFSLEPGQELQQCFFFEVPYDEPVFVKHIEIAQNAGTHHMNIFRQRTVGARRPTGMVDGPCWKPTNWSIGPSSSIAKRGARRA